MNHIQRICFYTSLLIPVNGDKVVLLDKQSKFGMTLVGIGVILLFVYTQEWVDFPEFIPFISILLAFLGMLTLMLSIGVESEFEELSQTFTMMEEEE